MTKSSKSVKRIIANIESVKNIETVSKELGPLSLEEVEALDNFTYSREGNTHGMDDRIAFLAGKSHHLDYITGRKKFGNPEVLKGNIENYIGMAQIPIGLAGPLLVHGIHAKGDYYIPLATTEGALVASYNRGMKVCRMSGGITSVCLTEGMQRSPYFKFDHIGDAGIFVKWVHDKQEEFGALIAHVSNHARLTDIKTNIEGNSVIVTFEYTTGDAAGQNMVTICTDRICAHIVEFSPVTPKLWYIESNYSGDKKATAYSFSNVRGKKVTAEIVLPRKVVAEVLKSTPEQIAGYWQASTLAVIQSGSIGAQGHVANALTALFIACGQDVACIAESSVGITRMETNGNGDLYAALTLPTLVVGTIGGGTWLPTQKECLDILDCSGEGGSGKFAEICCAVSLAGEISIASALSANHFTSAHQNLGRRKDG